MVIIRAITEDNSAFGTIIAYGGGGGGSRHDNMLRLVKEMVLLVVPVAGAEEGMQALLIILAEIRFHGKALKEAMVIEHLTRLQVAVAAVAVVQVLMHLLTREVDGGPGHIQQYYWYCFVLWRRRRRRLLWTQWRCRRNRWRRWRREWRYHN
jgi:hypothetical protein